jgi:hypothetical protein
MKITIIGTTSYRSMMLEHSKELQEGGHEVNIPAFSDHSNLDVLEVCVHNRDIICWADEVHIFWNQRSIGTIFNFGMCFALEKPVRIIYMGEKTLKNVMEKYQDRL